MDRYPFYIFYILAFRQPHLLLEWERQMKRFFAFLSVQWLFAFDICLTKKLMDGCFSYFLQLEIAVFLAKFPIQSPSNNKKKYKTF